MIQMSKAVSERVVQTIDSMLSSLQEEKILELIEKAETAYSLARSIAEPTLQFCENQNNPNLPKHEDIMRFDFIAQTLKVLQSLEDYDDALIMQITSWWQLI